MMDWTDRHCRYFMRLLSPSAFLYTEMVTAAAIHHGVEIVSLAVQFDRFQRVLRLAPVRMVSKFQRHTSRQRSVL